jgi:bifunctional non-homologous end joining protein LigD
VIVPVDVASTYDQSWRFAHGVAAVLIKRNPALVTLEFIKADREGRILIDVGRNAPGATFAAAYALRARPGAPVSAPCTWSELEVGAVAPQTFKLKTMAQRLAQAGDIWAELHAHEQSLAKPLKQVEGMLTEEDWSQARAASTRRPRTRKLPR